MRRLVLAAIGLCALCCGCDAVRDAREAQQVLRPLGNGEIAVVEPIDLRGSSLAQLVDFALTNRPSVVSARLAVEDARLALRQLAADAPIVSATPWTAPKLTLSGAYSETSRGTSLSTADFSTHGGDPQLGVSLGLLIWDFGRNDAQLRSQAEAVIAAEEELVNTGYSVFYEVASAYFTLLEKGAHLEVAYTNEYVYTLHLEQVERRCETGDAKRLDLLRARLDLAQARENTVNARLNLRTAGAEMMRTLGVDADFGSREELMDFDENALTFVLKGLPETDYGTKDAFANARTNSPAIRLARARLRGASAAVDAAVADLYPELSVNATFHWTDPLWYFGWGVEAAQSLFTGFRKTTAIERAVVSMRSLAAALDTAEQQLSADLQTAIANRDNAREARTTAYDALLRARENLDMIDAQYRVGDVSRVDFSDSVADYTKAMGDLIGAFYHGQRSEAALCFLIGALPVYEEKKLTEVIK